MSLATDSDFLQGMAVAAKARDTAARSVLSDAQQRSLLTSVAAAPSLVLVPDQFDVIAELKSAAREVVAEVAAENELSQRIYDSYMGFFEEVRAYHEISEQAYLNAR